MFVKVKDTRGDVYRINVESIVWLSDAGRVVALNATITDTGASGSFVKQFSMPIKFHLEEESYKKLLAVLDEGVA